MALYSYEIGVPFTGTGTAKSTNGSVDVAGTASDFQNQFNDGDLIIIAGETRVVDGEPSGATTLAVTVAFTTGSGGVAVAYTGAVLTNVESLVTTGNLAVAELAPKSTFIEHSEMVALGNGEVRGAGFKAATWRFGFLSRSQRNKLRVLCTTASNAVYIRTRENDTSDAYTYYSGVMVWPVEEKDHGTRLDFTLAFKSLTEVSIS